MTTEQTLNKTKGLKLAETFRPFISPGVKKASDVQPCVDAIGKAIDNTYKPYLSFIKEIADLGIRSDASNLSYHRWNSLIQKAIILINAQ